MRKLLTVSIVLLVAAFAYPHNSHAIGFAKQSLFLSQSAVYEGQNVFIYAVVTDDKPEHFYGSLQFSDKDGSIGKVSVSLEPGRATTVSVPWKPVEGEHTITATLVSEGGVQVEKQEATFVVNPPQSDSIVATGAASTATPELKPKTSVSSTTVDTSAPLLHAVSRISPAASQSIEPALFSVDSFRRTLVGRLDTGTEWSKIEITKSATAPSGIRNTLWMILSTFVLYTCASLAYAIGNIGIFFPVIALIFFLILWKIYRFIRT